MRWIVPLITTIALLAGICTTAEARWTDGPAPAQVKQTKSLPAASGIARRDGAARERRLPAFALPAPAIPEPPPDAVAAHRAVLRAGHSWSRASDVKARGPPRG